MTIFREFPAAAMCSVHGDPVTTTAHDTEADALAEADRQRGLRRVAVVWCVGEPTDAPDPAPAPTTHGRPSEAAHGQPRKPERDARGNYTSEIQGGRP